jgi:hypothetical protein
MSSRVLAAVLAGSLAVAGVASCAAFPAGPAAVAEAGTASLTVSPRFDGFAVQSTDIARFEAVHVNKLDLALYTVESNVETAVKTAANVPVVVTRTSGYTAPVTFDHLRYGNTYRVRATAYRLVAGEYEAISTTDSASYVDVVVTADTASLNQTHALKVKLIDRGLSARLQAPQTSLNAAPSQAGEARTAPAIAYNDEDNEYLLVWADARSGGALYGQRLAADGGRIGSEFAIAQGSVVQEQPAVAYSAVHDCFFVVWRDSRVVGDTGIYGQKVKRAHDEGQSDLIGSNIAIGGGLLGACRNPALVASNQGGSSAPFAVTWKNDLTAAIEVQALDASGAPSGLPVSRVPVIESFDSPALAQDLTLGRYFLAYTYQSIGNHAVVGHFLTPGVTSVGPGYPMGTPGLAKSGPAVAGNGQPGTFLVAWREGAGAGATIQACLFNEGAAPAVGPVMPISVGATAPGTPAVTYNGSIGEFLIAWIDQRHGVPQVQAQRLTAAGTAIGGNFALSVTGTADTRPALAYNTRHNQALAVWQAPGSYTADLFGRLLDYFARPLQAGEVTPS